MYFESHNYYYAYIVTNSERTVLETGVTGDLAVRYSQLKHGRYENDKIHKHTPGCFYFIYWERFSDVLKAMYRADAMKRLSNKKKIELLEKVNPEWEFLSLETMWHPDP